MGDISKTSKRHFDFLKLAYFFEIKKNTLFQIKIRMLTFIERDNLRIQRYTRSLFLILKAKYIKFIISIYSH